MNKSGGRILVSFIIFLTISVNALAGGVGTTGANYLKLDTGARSAALGSAYVGMSDDLNALYWNPAGIANIPYAAVDTMQLNWLAGITQQQIACVYPLGEWGVIGGYFSKLATPYDVETTYKNGNYNETGSKFNSEIKVVDLTYAKKLNSKLSVGLGLKQIQERLADVEKEGMGLDVSMLYKGLMLEDLSVGLVLQNYSLTPLRKDEPLPQTVILGTAYTLKLFKQQKLIFLGDISFPNDNDAFYGVGIEYTLNKYIAFRIGYKDKAGVTLGGGLYLGNFKLNYAYVPYGDLGTTYRIAVGYDFNDLDKVFEDAEDSSAEEKMKESENTLFEEVPAEEVVEEVEGVEATAPITTTADVEVTEDVEEEGSEEVIEDKKTEETPAAGAVSTEYDDLFED